jgi:hypothetical protein
MGWLLAYLAVLVLVCRWWYQWGIAKGRLLERIDRVERRAASMREPERHLYVVRGERWGDDGPGAA